MTATSDEAKEIAIIRDLACKDYYFFARYMFKKRHGFSWQRANHHPKICNALMRVHRGECRNLIINMPPRYSKTELGVVDFMPWCLGIDPDCEFIHTSYSARLATQSSWLAREMVMSEEYKQLFPNVILRDDSQAKDEWRTSAGGCVYATGGEGTITGYGAGKMRAGFGGAIIIDDAHKPDEILSDVSRPAVIERFQNTLESRKNSPHTPIIVIGQRLHEEDLPGWLLAGGNGEVWEHLNLPAIQEDGTALWSEKHTIEDLLRMQEAAPWMFSGQYQQRPTPPEGGIFKPDMIQVIDALPKDARKCARGWDFAATHLDGAYTVGAKLWQTIDKKIIIEDVRRLQGLPDKVEEALVATANLDGKRVQVSMPQDPGQAGKSQVLYFTKALAGFRVVSSPESGDKVTRAGPFASQVNIGNVYMVRGEWNRAYVEELRNFPYGKYKDQVDASSRAFNTLNETSSYDSSLSWVA